MGVGRLEGSGEPEQAYTLATEIFREELQKTSAVSEVAILREERLDESGQIRRLKTRPELIGVGDKLGPGAAEVDLASEPVEGLQLLVKGQEGFMSALAVAPNGGMLRTQNMYIRKLIVGPWAKGKIDIDALVADNVEATAEAVG